MELPGSFLLHGTRGRPSKGVHMKNSRMLIIATTAVCGIAFASAGISQTKTTTNKSSKTSVNDTKAKQTKTTHPVSGKAAGNEVTDSVAGKKVVDTRADRFDAKTVKTNDCLEAMRKAFKVNVAYDEKKCALTLGSRRVDLSYARSTGQIRESSRGHHTLVYLYCKDGQQCIENLKTKERSQNTMLYSYLKSEGPPGGLTAGDMRTCLAAFKAGCQ